MFSNDVLITFAWWSIFSFLRSCLTKEMHQIGHEKYEAVTFWKNLWSRNRKPRFILESIRKKNENSFEKYWVIVVMLDIIMTNNVYLFFVILIDVPSMCFKSLFLYLFKKHDQECFLDCFFACILHFQSRHHKNFILTIDVLWKVLSIKNIFDFDLCHLLNFNIQRIDTVLCLNIDSMWTARFTGWSLNVKTKSVDKMQNRNTTTKIDVITWLVKFHETNHRFLCDTFSNTHWQKECASCNRFRQ